MSHCLTQPEEIDHILKAMAGHDTKAGASIPDGAQPSGAVQSAERGELVAATGFSGFSFGDVYKKSEHGLPGP